MAYFQPPLVRDAGERLSLMPAWARPRIFLSYVYHSPWGLTSQGAVYAIVGIIALRKRFPRLS
jgi:hypothetical protein